MAFWFKRKRRIWRECWNRKWYSQTQSMIMYGNPYQRLFDMQSYAKITELNVFRQLMDNIYDNKLDCTDDDQYQYNSLSQFNRENNVNLTENEFKLLFDSAVATHCLHIQSRISAFEGNGYYTIGPCGEENLGCIGLQLNNNDAMV